MFFDIAWKILKEKTFVLFYSLSLSLDRRLTLWDSFQVVTAEREAQGFVWFAMQLSIISMTVPLGPISHLQVQNLQSRRQRTSIHWKICLVITSWALPHSKTAGDERGVVYTWDIRFLISYITSTHKAHDKDWEVLLPFSDKEKIWHWIHHTISSAY